MWNLHAQHRPSTQLAVVEPPVSEAREQSWMGKMPVREVVDLANYRPAPQDIHVRGPIRADSWLVTMHGKALFVTECQSFMRWFIENNPGATIESIEQGGMQDALARTALTNE